MKFLLTLTLLLSFYFVSAQNSEIKKFSIQSNSLNETRDLTLYFPKKFSAKKKYNLIFMADGQFLNERYKSKIDSLIDNKLISEFIIVGVNSNETGIPNSYLQLRNYEYIENNDAEIGSDLYSRYRNHLEFFISEVDEYVKEYLKIKVKKRFFYGVSNGAGFGISLLDKYPNFFKSYILYSVAGANKDNLKKSNNKISNIIIRYGNQEPEPIIDYNIALAELIKSKNYKVTFSNYKGGHKRIDWLNNFIKDIQLIGL